MLAGLGENSLLAGLGEDSRTVFRCPDVALGTVVVVAVVTMVVAVVVVTTAGDVTKQSLITSYN